jgi:hypothetical protein
VLLPSLSTSSSSSAAAAATSTTTTTAALTSFIYAIKSPESQRLYLGRLRQFFDFVGLSGSLEKQAETFLRKAKDNGAQQTQESTISFINYYKESSVKRFPLAHSITTTILSNYSVK